MAPLDGDKIAVRSSAISGWSCYLHGHDSHGHCQWPGHGGTGQFAAAGLMMAYMINRSMGLINRENMVGIMVNSE